MRTKTFLRPVLLLTAILLFCLSSAMVSLAADNEAEVFSSPVITAGSGQTATGNVSFEAPGGSSAGEDAGSQQGESLGMFTTTGYDTESAGGRGLTYSGTVPQAQHTISADLDRFPLGTQLMIDGIVYTVEDKGNHIQGNWLDIYYDSHAEALAHGRKTQEVFAVVE
ncbi:MAG: 3D domain-containing protein [Clostridiales bacterium]|nr:3D domain-containing protein [Clostridiales bacterium]